MCIPHLGNLHVLLSLVYISAICLSPYIPSSVAAPISKYVRTRRLYDSLVKRERDNWRQRNRDKPEVLERQAGAVKGYYVVIIVLCVFILTVAVGWVYIYYKDRKAIREAEVNRRQAGGG